MRQKVEDLFRSSHHAVVLTRNRAANYEVLLWNPGAEALFGYRAADILGRSVTCLLPGDPDVGAQVEQVRASTARCEPCELENVPRLHKSGELRFVDVRYAGCRDPAGEELMLFTFRDRLRHADMIDAVQSDRRAVFSSMTARLAHELRNPLSSVLLNLALLRDSLNTSPPSPATARIDQDAVLTAAESQIARIQAVLQQYVDAARGAECPDDVFAALAELLA